MAGLPFLVYLQGFSDEADLPMNSACYEASTENSVSSGEDTVGEDTVPSDNKHSIENGEYHSQVPPPVSIFQRAIRSVKRGKEKSNDRSVNNFIITYCSTVKYILRW